MVSGSWSKWFWRPWLINAREQDTSRVVPGRLGPLSADRSGPTPQASDILALVSGHQSRGLEIDPPHTSLIMWGNRGPELGDSKWSVLESRVIARALFGG